MGLYLITDLSDYPWYRSEHRHGLPAGGLIVVRELCFADTHNESNDWWHGEDAILWDAEPGSWPVILPSLLSADSKNERLEEIVPVGFLQSIKEISVEVGSTLTYYHHAMWGGDTEYEFAWIFGTEDRATKFLDYEKVMQIRIGNPPESMRGSVLKSVMSQLGVSIPTGYFAPHARRFNWHRYRHK
jgi:hypothetical protein